MVVILPYVFALIIVIITVVEEIRFRNYRKPEKVAKKFALIAIVFGILQKQAISMSLRLTARHLLKHIHSNARTTSIQEL